MNTSIFTPAAKLLLNAEAVENYLLANSTIEELPVNLYQTEQGEKMFCATELVEFVDPRLVKQMQTIFITTILEANEVTILN